MRPPNQPCSPSTSTASGRRKRRMKVPAGRTAWEGWYGYSYSRRHPAALSKPCVTAEACRRPAAVGALARLADCADVHPAHPAAGHARHWEGARACRSPACILLTVRALNAQVALLLAALPVLALALAGNGEHAIGGDLRSRGAGQGWAQLQLDRRGCVGARRGQRQMRASGDVYERARQERGGVGC